MSIKPACTGEHSCYVGFVTAAGETTGEVVHALNSAGKSISLELEPIECQTWECEIESTCGHVAPELFEIEGLSSCAVSRARDLVCEMLVSAQFSEFLKDIAATKAANCLESLEAGHLGKTSADYWLISKNRGVIVGARSDDSCFISCFAVLPQFGRNGLAQALVYSLMSRFARQGQTVMKVVIDPREPAALATYRSLGFTPSNGLDQTCCCS